MPRAICYKCGNRYHGWALLNPKYQRCACGRWLIVINGNEILDCQTGLIVELE